MPRGRRGASYYAALGAGAYGAASSAGRYMGNKGAKWLTNTVNGATSRGKYSQYKQSRRKTRNYTSRNNTELRPSAYLSKRRQFDESPGVKNGNVLYTQEISKIPQDNTIDGRERAVIKLKGVKINHWIFNEQTKPMMYRWALIQFKHNTSSASTSNVKNEFFRSQGDQRVVNFDVLTNAQHKHTYGINTDRFHVHGQGSFLLSAVTDTTTKNETRDNYRMVSTYVPVNKLAHYEGPTDDDCTEALIFCYWANVWDKNNTTADTAAINTRSAFTLYFQD